MNVTALFALALDPARILTAQGLTPDPWQREVLLSTARDILLNCSRGAGKSRVTSALALHTALFRPRSLVDFTRQAWSILEPSQPYVHGWHMDAIAEHLQAITAGQMGL